MKLGKTRRGALEPPPGQGNDRQGGDGETAKQIEKISAILDAQSRTWEAHARKHETDETDKYRHDGKVLRWARIGAIATIAYTLLTVAVLVISIRSLHESHRTSEAAISQAKTAADTESRQLRAYVIAIDSSVRTYEVGKPITVVFTLKNFGQTPALELKMKGVTQVVPQSGIDRYSIIDYRGVETINSITLAPGKEYESHTFETPLKINLTENNKRLLDSGDLAIVFYGTLYYSDIFGHSWKTDFCYAYRGSNVPTRTNVQCTNHWGIDDKAEGDLPK